MNPRHTYFEIDPAKAAPELLRHPATVRMSHMGRLAGVALSVLEQQGYFDPGGIDIRDEPRPLLTLPFLDFLDRLDLRDQRITELGSGQSTLFFQQRFAAVRAYETDATWIERLRPRLASNVDLRLVTVAALEDADVPIEPGGWLLLDFAGRRTRFLQRLLQRHAMAALPDVIVFDNAEWYRNGAALLAQAGYQEIPFIGLKSNQAYVAVTSVFLRPGAAPIPLREPMGGIPYTRPVDNAWDRLD